MTELVPHTVWVDVAARLKVHWDLGRGHLLTEDTLRMESVKAMGAAGIAPARLQAEVLAPELLGGKLDLVVDHSRRGAVLEFKYPRDSRTGISPDTMTLGELIRDFLRVQSVPAEERWVVQVLNARLVRYLQGVEGRFPLRWSTVVDETLTLDPHTLQALPATALRAIGSALVPGVVRARCVVAASISNDLKLYAYLVAPPEELVKLLPAIEVDVTTTPDELVAEATRGNTGARREILAAVDRVLTRNGSGSFTVAEVITEMRAVTTKYADQTVRTMIGAHMNVDAVGPGISAFADFRRIDRGRYVRA